MKKYLVPPDFEFKDYHTQAKFDLTWKLFVFNSLFLGLNVLVYLLLSPEAVWQALYAWIVALGLHIVFYKTRRYRRIGFLYTVHAAFFLTYTLNFMPHSVHGIEFFWMILFTLYTIFAIGRVEGYIVMVLNAAGIVFYFLYSFQENMSILQQELQGSQLLATVLNIIVASALIAYIVNQFIQLNSYAETKFKAANLELKNQNRLVQAQNEEKTIMLKEIHHRVKNNLQVISSLLRLQSHEIEEESTRLHFKDAVHRVAAMALIHEQMYQNEDLAKIDLKIYLESLAKELIRTYGGETQIEMKIESDLRRLGNDTLVPVALIFNELISNSLKHAFRHQHIGKIEVELFEAEKEGLFSLMYKDDGVWADAAKENSFGLELITTLTEQLDGKVQRTFEEGTKYEFMLKDAG